MVGMKVKEAAPWALCAMLAVLSIALWATRPAPPPSAVPLPQSIDVQRLRIVDGAGRVRGVLGVRPEDGSVGFLLLSTEGKPRIAATVAGPLGGNAGQASLSICDEADKASVMASVYRDGDARLFASGNDGKLTWAAVPWWK